MPNRHSVYPDTAIFIGIFIRVSADFPTPGNVDPTAPAHGRIHAIANNATGEITTLVLASMVTSLGALRAARPAYTIHSPVSVSSSDNGPSNTSGNHVEQLTRELFPVTLKLR